MTPLHRAIHSYIPPMEGWTTPERGCEMADAILALKPEVVVEIGVFGGRSLISQAFALRENNRGVIYGIDPMKKEAALEGECDANREWWDKLDLDAVHNKAVHAIWQHNLDAFAVIIRAASQDVYQLFPRIDMLTIDGNHSEIASVRDVELYVPKVRKGGLIWFDDSDWTTTQPALELIEKTCVLERSVGTCRVYRK